MEESGISWVENWKLMCGSFLCPVLCSVAVSAVTNSATGRQQLARGEGIPDILVNSFFFNFLIE